MTTLQLEVPAGLIEVTAHCRDGRVTLVEFENVPSFATAVDVPIEVAGFGTVPVSVAWPARRSTRTLSAWNSFPTRRGVGEAIAAVCLPRAWQIGFRHPLNPELAEVEATVVMGPPRRVGNHAPQTCGIPAGQMDTSPSGTGTSAGMAVLRSRGQLTVGQPFRTEGLLGGSSTVGSPARRPSATSRRSSRVSAAAPGSRATPATCCRKTTRFPRASS